MRPAPQCLPPSLAQPPPAGLLSRAGIAPEALLPNSLTCGPMAAVDSPVIHSRVPRSRQRSCRPTPRNIYLPSQPPRLLQRLRRPRNAPAGGRHSCGWQVDAPPSECPVTNSTVMQTWMRGTCPKSLCPLSLAPPVWLPRPSTCPLRRRRPSMTPPPQSLPPSLPVLHIIPSSPAQLTVLMPEAACASKVPPTRTCFSASWMQLRLLGPFAPHLLGPTCINPPWSSGRRSPCAS
mmetsp:Transcript_3671/g.10629  ORF Transcript_3671/g.10629 Transcript_3671/m.10629 type:complete len:234 (-) Transcript_3671:1293-1994(-)